MLLPNLRISFDYVLILEWLDIEDRRTGADLHTFLQKLSVPTCLVQCKSAEDVRLALDRAVTNMPGRGIPIVHIESHGSNPFDQENVRDADFGMNAAPGLSWSELGDWLAPLNVASGFRLLLVGATCFGYAAIAAMKTGEHPAPFAATVGFTTTVGEGSLHSAMKEFYRSICERHEKLPDAVSSAARELRAPEKVRATTSPVLAVHILRGVYDTVRPGEPLTAHAAELVEKLRKEGLAVAPQVGDAMPSVLHNRGRTRVVQAWNDWFPVSAQQEPAFRLDWDWIERADLTD